MLDPDAGDCSLLNHPIVDGHRCPCGTRIRPVAASRGKNGPTTAPEPLRPAPGADDRTDTRWPARSNSYASLFASPSSPATSSPSAAQRLRPRPGAPFRARRLRDLARY